MFRNKDNNFKIKDDFTGMVPYSLELIKLKSEGLKIKIDKITGKETSKDIINVKFKFKVQSAEDIVMRTQKKINKLQKENATETNVDKKGNVEKYILSLKKFITYLEQEKAKEADVIFTRTFDANSKETKKTIYHMG